MSTRNFYLQRLSLNNFATFENQSIEFDNDFNAIVGETGSGKSLILDALALIFGSRSDKKLIRKGSDQAIIEAVFNCEDERIKNYFDTIGHPVIDNEVVVKRIIYSNGKSKAFMNFGACQVQMLGEIAKRFIDVVGQFENQKLLSTDYQLVLLDQFCQHQPKVDLYAQKYKSLLDFRAQQEKLEAKHREIALTKDYLEYQINELEKLSPTLEEEELLIKRKDFLMNREKFLGLKDSFLNILSEDEDSALTKLHHLTNVANKNGNLFSVQFTNKLSEAISLLEDLSFELSSENGDIADEEENLEEIIDKLDSYSKLKRKFNLSTQELSEHLDKLKLELGTYNDLDLDLAKVKKQIDILSKELRLLANELHTERAKKAKTLEQKLTKMVQGLNMQGATIRLEVTMTNDIGPKGITALDFMAQTNPGEGFYRVKEIASGGELSRILLSLRQVVSSQDSISVFLFDEIDTGIGGATALKIGKALQNVSEFSQVVAITHLPQIAIHAKSLIEVKKQTIGKGGKERTVSLAQEILANQRENFIKSMMPLH